MLSPCLSFRECEVVLMNRRDQRALPPCKGGQGVGAGSTSSVPRAPHKRNPCSLTPHLAKWGQGGGGRPTSPVRSPLVQDVHLPPGRRPTKPARSPPGRNKKPARGQVFARFWPFGNGKLCQASISGTNARSQNQAARRLRATTPSPNRLEMPTRTTELGSGTEAVRVFSPSSPLPLKP